MSKHNIWNLLLTCLMLTTGVCDGVAQSVDQLLMAVQERQLAIAQRTTIEVELHRHANADSEDLPDEDPVEQSDLIDWGSGLPPFPSAQEIEALPVSQLLQVLNKASRSLDYLKKYYLNLDLENPKALVVGSGQPPDFQYQPSEFRGSVFGAYAKETMGFLPSTGHINEGNWRVKVLLMASQVEKLKSLLWPCEVSEYLARLELYSHTEGTPNGNLGYKPEMPMTTAESPGESTAVNYDLWGGASVRYGTPMYSWAGMGYYNDFWGELMVKHAGIRALRAIFKPTTSEGHYRLIQDGEIKIFKGMALGAAADWVVNQVYAENGATLAFNHAMFCESAQNNLTWNVMDYEWPEDNQATPEQIQSMEAALRDRWAIPELAVEGEYVENELGYWEYVTEGFRPETWWDQSRFNLFMHCVCVPQFTPMLGASERALLTLSGGNPGAVEVPLARELVKIGLGRGLSDYGQTAFLTVGVDGFGSMIFGGSVNDFKVFYDKDVDTFGDPLVEDPFGLPFEWFEVTRQQQTGWDNKLEYGQARSQPRLRQVYGADVVVDIIYHHDYRKILRFYWAKDVPLPEENVFAPQQITAEAFKTIIVENATVDEEPAFPTSGRKLHIDDAGMHLEIEKVADPFYYDASAIRYTLKAGSSEGNDDLYTRTVEIVSGMEAKETTVQLGVSTEVTTQYYSESYNRFSDNPLPTRMVQGGRQVDYGYQVSASMTTPEGWAWYSAPALTSITCSGSGWDMNGANVTWNADGTLASEKRNFHGDEFNVTHSWNNRVRTTTSKLGSIPYRTETFTLGEGLTEETTTTGGTSTVVKYKGGGDSAPWTLNQIRHFNGYVQTFNLTPGLDETVLQALEGWGETHDAGTQTLTTTNRGGGLVSQEVKSLSGNVILSSVNGSEHFPWGAPKRLTGRHNDITELTWQETGRSAGQMLTAESPTKVISGVAGYDVQGRPTAFKTGFATYTPSYADPLKISLSGPSGTVASTLNEFGDSLDFNDTHGAGLELDLTPGGGHLKVDGRTADLDINAVGEVTGVKSGLGQRGARVEFSVETVDGYPQKKLCRTEHARRQNDADDFVVKTFFDDRDRVIRRETPAVNGGVLAETWTYNDAGRSVTYSPGPAASYKPVTQTVTNSDNSTIVTTVRGGVNFSRSTTKYEGGKVVNIEEIFDDSHGGGGAWSQVSRTQTDPATGITTAQPWDLTAATATSTMPVPAEITAWVGSSGATDDTQEVTRTKGRITRIHGRRAGADFNLSNWQYVNDRLVGVAGTFGGRNVALEFNAKGQVSRVAGPGFDKSFELTGTSGFEFKETDSTQGTMKVVKASAVGDTTEVSGDVNEPKVASTVDLGNGETRTVLNANLTVTKTVTGAVRSKAYAGGAMATTTHTFTSDNLPDVSTTGEESVNRDFSQYVSSNKITSYYPEAGTVEEEFYGSGPRKKVKAPLDERTFTHLRQEEASTIHGPDSIWAGASSARSQDNKGSYAGLVVAVPGSDGYSDQRWYNASGQPYKITSGNVTAIYEYDEVTGELESITRGPLTTSVIRDNLGRVTGYNTSNSSGENFGYGSGYNARNLRSSRTASNGVSWTGLAYDNRQRLTDAGLSTGGGLHYDYDDRNNRDHGGGPVTFANNGVDQVTGRTIGQRGYGVRGRVAPGSVVRVFHPQAGPGGEEITTDPVTGAYVAYWTASGGFDSGVNRVELLVRGTLAGAGTGGTDAVADQSVWAVLPASAESYEYDGAGRMEADSMWNYTWDAMGRLVGMARKAGTSVDPTLTGEVLAFVYDADGHRTQKTRTRSYQNAPNKVDSSKVYWSKWLPVCEEISIDGSTPSRRWFVWGQDLSGSWEGAGGIGGLLAIREEGGRTLLPVHDGLGNITAVINAADGDTVAQYDYAPFGELLVESGDVNACPFRYQSKYYDAETGLSYFGFRYYSAKLGRWISRDPLGESGGFNLYGYCGNDPVNRWDYLGLDAEFRFYEHPGVGSTSSWSKYALQVAVSSGRGRAEFRTIHGDDAARFLTGLHPESYEAMLLESGIYQDEASYFAATANVMVGRDPSRYFVQPIADQTYGPGSYIAAFFNGNGNLGDFVMPGAGEVNDDDRPLGLRMVGTLGQGVQIVQLAFGIVKTVPPTSVVRTGGRWNAPVLGGSLNVPRTARSGSLVPYDHAFALRQQDAVLIEFKVSKAATQNMTLADRQAFISHLAEQEAALNYMSLFRTSDLEFNLQMYSEFDELKLVDQARAKAARRMKLRGSGMDAAHALDAVAGGYIHNISFARNPVQRTIGAIWRTRRLEIRPGQRHQLVPVFE